MTEEEAKTKWCPAYREPDNRGDHKSVNCIGSACMAWRWQRISPPGLMAGTGQYSDTDGYCGLAGKP